MNYLYYDNHTGENFYVNADNKDSADRIAYFYFDDPEFVCIDDDIIAEMTGVRHLLSRKKLHYFTVVKFLFTIFSNLIQVRVSCGSHNSILTIWFP